MTASDQPQYYLNDDGEQIITDYNSTKLFSSFFPGVAGKTGIPMWLFYVNRGQCVCSMGIQDKQHPIMEFLPANRAYQLVSTQGFRTFIKPAGNTALTFYEPFQNHFRDKAVERNQRLIIAPSRLTLEETNQTLGLRFTIEYFNVPQADYAGLVRILRIQNLDSAPVTLEGLDGLPLIIPYGVDNYMLKQMRRLVEAFVEVSNFEQGVPFFRGKVEPADRPDVIRIVKGNFYVGFESGGAETRLIAPIVDPVKIFGSMSDYSYPERFLTDSAAEMTSGQILENRLPCAMSLFQTTIPAGETYTYTSIIGHASSIEALNELIPVISRTGYVEAKSRADRELIEELTQPGFICSREPVLDRYARQNFLDNTLRGGFPHTLNGNEHRAILHLYSRKHGDLERDYNDYRLTPTNFSQGNGNFRDINQNRRCDLFFNPDVGASNVEQFCNLIQLDGFNPLVIKETRFEVTDRARLEEILSVNLGAGQLESVETFLREPFTPGGLMTHLQEQRVALSNGSEALLGDLLPICARMSDTEHGEGFWNDHWTYNLDLLENYLAVFPEHRNRLLFEQKIFTFYDNAHRVQPRDEKYVIWDGNAMQLGAVVHDEEKEALISRRARDRNRVHTRYGEGEVYYTTLFNLLFCLIVNKMASLDPAGVGVEMEADKPGWYDALNGLPGLMGSSVCETLEIKRHILFLLAALRDPEVTGDEWPLFAELQEFMTTLSDLLARQLSPFEFWERATTAKEAFRAETRLGINGDEKRVARKEIEDFFTACLVKLEEGIAKAWDVEQGIIHTYFINEVTDYSEIEQTIPDGGKTLKRNPKGLPCFRALAFKQVPLPLFLEGPVHYLRCNSDPDRVQALVDNIRRSGLYDEKLGMYKVNASLAGQPMEIGRARTFSPGWFENESVWLHMEYKYMLELLRNELHGEFYRDFKQVFVPFFKPEVYGRSILENSSFIVSSANPDPSLYGNGFVARLSGATAEFIHILMLMTVGAAPFQVNPTGELQLRFQPALAEWLFTRTAVRSRLLIDGSRREVEFPANSFSFMFLGSILVTYRNPGLIDTFGPDGVAPTTWEVFDLAGNSQVFQGETLSGDIVERIRDRKVSRINIELS